MNLIEQDNFFTVEYCEKIINNFKKYENNYKRHSKRSFIDLLDYQDDDLFKEIINKYFEKDKIKNIQIVSWDVGETAPWHDDSKYYKHTTITYLNEGYLGGRTIVQNNEIVPKTGKYVKFDSKEKHMVTKLISGERFVLICWY